LLLPDMDSTMALAGVVGIAPALALMYWTMSRYTYPKVDKPFFDDRKVFSMFAVGMVIGVIVFGIQSWFPLDVLYVALAFALVEELLKLVILNMPRFQRKLDTAFYGLSLGLGIGATMAFGAAFSIIATADQMSPLDWVLILVLAVQFVTLHASTGATIGTGVAKGYPFEIFTQAAMVHIAYSLLMVAFFAVAEPWWYVTVPVATVLLVSYYLYVHYRLLPSLVEEALSEMKSKGKG
jgi:RsiW-degrading membrane proteinase PrsW (M82 family)